MCEISCDYCDKSVSVPTPGLSTVWYRTHRGEIITILVCQECEVLFEPCSLYCETCGQEGKRADGSVVLIQVLRTLPTGEQEDILVCEECSSLFTEKIRYLWTVLEGPTYTDENRPPGWDNQAPLQYQGYHPSPPELEYVRLHDPERYAEVVKLVVLDTAQLPLDDFPLIEDFEIILQTGRMKHRPPEQQPLYRIFACSPSLGYLTLLDYTSYFPQDLCQPDFVIPHGTFTIPYADLHQGWNILLAENEQYVYILTGNWERNEGYSTWFKVEKRRYYSQWEQAIQLCRSVVKGIDREAAGGTRQ